ncbi:MAG: response regulator [Candidatus Tumulicola sp.]
MATILIVDDDANSRLLAATLLEPAGHVVLQAAGADEAFHRLNERRIDLILTDLSMPATSGAAFIRTLRSDPQRASMPIVLYSGSDPHAVFDDFIAIYRISGFIQKPIDPHGFVGSVESALGGLPST